MLSDDNPIFYRILDGKKELTIREYCQKKKVNYFSVLFSLVYKKPLHEILGLEENQVKHLKSFANEKDLDVTTVAANEECLDKVPIVKSIDWDKVYNEN